MGIPTDTSPPTNTTNPSTNPPTNTNTNTNPPSSPSQLPPAALDLATKLFDLSRTGSTPLLQTYISSGVPPNLTNSSGSTLLMLASYHGHAPTVSMLLDHGADPNVLNDRGQSPVAGAVFKGEDEVVEVLWRKGGCDLEAGKPTARECAKMFRRERWIGEWGCEGIEVPGQFEIRRDGEGEGAGAGARDGNGNGGAAATEGTDQGQS